MRGHRYRLPLAAVAAIAAVGVATLILRPRGGLLEAAAVEPTAYFSAEELERARDYRGTQRLIAVGGLVLSAATLAVLALRPPQAFRRLLGRFERRPLFGGAIGGAAIVLILTLVTLPVAAAGHERAVEVGLSTQTVEAWLGDQAKAAAIGAAMAAAGGLLAVALVRRFPRNWWAPACVVVVLASALLVYAAPVVLDPVFNRFDPLPEGELRSSVLELADGAGIEVGEVYRVDASRRTTGSNAYVGGLGPTKRVVLYDNLIEGLPPEQVESVVAHELGHVANHDVPRGLLWVAILAPPGMLLVQRLAEAIWRRSDRRGAGTEEVPGRRGAAGPSILPAVALSLALVTFAGQVASNWLSRRVEARADAFALELTDESAAFIGLQRALAVENVSEPDPPDLFQAVFGTHPTTVERIGSSLDWARQR